MFLSYHEDISSGSAIVLLAAGFFALVYAGTTLHHALRPAPRLAAELEPAEQMVDGAESMIEISRSRRTDRAAGG